ncbi:MAG: ATP-dependent sacrificial sulfur transferase LarE, partial [Methanomassiliicoccales archaeon]|nr:ATP-dependent sacrificial sulfur transferase LarE [Methanomassiliicoccales archaeon]
AFSGGVDSTLLLKACLDSGAETAAFMALGEIFFPEEQRKALALAEGLGVKVLTFKVDLVNDERFARNWDDRCYVCKSAIFHRIKEESKKRERPFILEGSQIDDLKEVRPGRGALMEMNIRSPLIEAKLNKDEVRSLLKEFGIPNWNAPSNTCIATRVPFDVRVNGNILRRVERAETLLAPYGFRSLRVRDHGYWARIEVAPEDLPRLFAERAKIVEALGRLGYRNVAMDLVGYSH